MDEALDVEKILAAQRPRLVRLCARLSGNRDAAEDLAQETLLQAWCHADRLQGWNQAAPWLSAIARNVCLHWSRHHYHEQARLDQLAYADSPRTVRAADQLHNDFDLEFELERNELVTLLDRALALLRPETRAVLVQKYVEESPHAEIAARLGLSENAVAVRVHRGKLAFRRVLANELRAEAVAYGLLDSESATWEETRIWCPLCGQRRLFGRFQNSAPTGVFELRCPACDEGAIATRADLSIPFFAKLLSDIKSYKPAYSRLLTAVGNYCWRAMATQAAPCLACGRETCIRLGARDNVSPDDSNGYEVRVRCRACGWEMNDSLGSLVMILPEAQRFWHAHPRLRTLPTCEIEVTDTPALVTRLRSVTGEAGLDVISVRDTFAIIGVYSVRDP
jgi:RNA polymerase sigma factor (sigma-70 family)